VAVRVPALVGAPTEDAGCTEGCEICRRLRAGLLEDLARHDSRPVAASELAARAGLSEADLVDHYDSVDACLVAVFDELAEQLYDIQAAAFAAGSGDWRSRLLDGMRAGLDHLASSPGAVRLFFDDELRAHPLLRLRRAGFRRRVALLVADERGLEHEPGQPPVQAEFLLGALSHAALTEVAGTGMDPARVVARVRRTLRLLEPRAA
jgi:AcrR family transcriptional regulator